MKVGIVNVTGYAGVELARLLQQHPKAKLTSVTGRSAVGQKLGDFFPHLVMTDLTIESELEDVDLAFSAMPHGKSVPVVIALLERGIKVVDISADFRLKSADEYPEWYDFDHPAPELLEEAVYGLTELYRPQIAQARLVANPGCYPTGIILALAPLVKAGLIKADITVDSKSGISGAGRTPSVKTLFSEASEDVTAYSLQGHRHLPEVIQEIKLLNNGKELPVTFIPHLIPMTRGILSTCYAQPASGKLSADKKGEEELRAIYQDFYKDEPFVKVVPFSPHTKYTWGNNTCFIHPMIDKRTGKIILISCLDNLVKGAAGQAIQNMNLMLGLPEVAGLEAPAIFP